MSLMKMIKPMLVSLGQRLKHKLNAKAMTQHPPGMPHWYKVLADEVVHPGLKLTVNSESSMSTVLSVLLKPSRMCYQRTREYTFILPYPNFEKSRVVDLRFYWFGLGGVINGIPLHKCIGWINTVKLYMKLRNY